MAVPLSRRTLSALLAVCAALAALALAQRADDAACLALDAQADCVGADPLGDGRHACAWITNLTSDGALVDTCRGCSLFSLNRGGCLAHCAYYDAESGFCGIAAPTPQPTPMPLDVDTSTRVAQGSVVLDMDVVNFDGPTRAAFERAMAETLGAEHVYLDDIDGETCGDAPLCASDPAMIDFVADFTNVPIPELAACCPARDTARTEDCQALDLAGGACRVAGVQEPFCADPVSGGSDRCVALQSEDGRDSTDMVLELAFESNGFEVTCCTNCTCYGDPNCVSFDGTKSSWRLCDGRDTRAGRDCELTRHACLQRADHEGSQCVWKGDDWRSNWQDGSPCQVRADAGEAWLLMYAADSFRFRISQDERGVIRSAEMTTSAGVFSLNASRCISGAGLEDSWTWSEGPMVDAPEFTHDWQRVSVDGLFDVLWYTFDEATGIQQTIRCLGTRNPSNGNQYGNLRLNIEALVEPETDFASERSDLGGFCFTNDLVEDEYQTDASRASFDEHLAVDAVCSSVETPFAFAEALALGRIFCGSGLSLNGLDACFASFCAAHAFPNTDADDCVALFAARELDDAFCSVAWKVESARDKCRDNIDEFGFDQEVSDFFLRVSEGTGDCVETRADLPVSLADCQAGVTLQYQAVDGDEDSWTDLVAFPEGTVLCAGGLQFRPEGAELPLFTRPVRLQQCSQSVTCGALEQCQTQAGIAARIRFQWPRLAPPTPSAKPSAAPVVPTLPPATVEPTFKPTSGPTFEEARPSLSPIGSPTAAPSPWPTLSPSLAPAEPTSSPSAAPSPWPTLSPSAAPSPWPTLSPSAAPSPWPTLSPAVPTQSPTQTNQRTDAPVVFTTQSPTQSPTTGYPTRSPSTLEPSASPSSSPTTSEPSASPSSSPSTMAPSASPSASPSTMAPSLSPSSSPSTMAPSPSPSSSCEVQCPDNTSPPTPSQGQRVRADSEGDACSSATLVFTAADLEAEDFCSCDFAAAGAIPSEGGSRIDLGAACPALVASVDTEALESVCQLACYLVDNDSGRCDAWDIDYDNDVCNLYACGGSAPAYSVDSEFVTGLPCAGGAPVARPTTWTRPTRNLAAVQLRRPSEALAGPVPRRALATRRVLEESGRERYSVSFWAVFADPEAQTSSTQASLENNAQAMGAMADMLLAEPALAAVAGEVQVASFFAGRSYKGFDVRFPDMRFDARRHRSADFLREVCDALQRAFKRRSSLNNVNCGEKMLDFRAHGDAAGDLVVLFRVQNVRPGGVNDFLESAAGQRELSRQLSAANLEDVKVLAAAFPSDDEGAGGLGGAAAAAVAIGVVAAVVVGAAVVVRRRQQQNLSSDEQVWGMVHYFQSAGKKAASTLAVRQPAGP